MKRFVCLVLLLLLPAVALSAVKATPPQALLDALAKVEQDRQDSALADASIKIAQVALDAGVKAKAAATAAMAADSAAFQKLWSELYGPTPAPTPTPPPLPPDPPTPPVPPVPPVPPPPVPQKVQIVVLEETGDSTAAFSAVRNSKEIRQWAEAGGHAIFFIDRDSAAKGPGSWPGWAKRAEGKPLPFMFVSPHEGGEPLKECAAPQSVFAFLELLKIYGGVGSSRPAEPLLVPKK